MKPASLINLYGIPVLNYHKPDPNQQTFLRVAVMKLLENHRLKDIVSKFQMKKAVFLMISLMKMMSVGSLIGSPESEDCSDDSDEEYLP